ncbi:MAG: serine/threonine-protein kinase [Deltaproteobacteria bacterium]
MPRRSFGKYEVLARLATGGAASIFLARQPGAAGFHKLVVLKTLLPERAIDADFVAMFLDEARLAARLNHPNCVQIYDLGRVRGVYYISMEYIFGETLWNLLTTVTRLRTPLPPAHVASILASACDGLHHAHELKDPNGKAYHLVHRDVSPQNVMITFEGQTKVVDFGIAKAETGRAPTMAGIVKGKFSYMSPEQITGGEVDRRSDIFSLGIVLFECLASRRLYRGDTPEEIAKLILEHRAPRLRDVVPDIPLALDEVCARALARHPSKRFATAAQMAEALRNHLDEVRHNQSASATAKLLGERFEGITDRRRAYEGALNGTYDEDEFLKVLDARAVRDLDLFPDEEINKPDFDEPMADRPPTPSVTVAPADQTLDEKQARWRVDTRESPPPPIEMISQSSRLTDNDRTGVSAEAEIDPTRLDPTAPLTDDPLEFEDRTQFDPETPEEEASDADATDTRATAENESADSTRVDFVADVPPEDGEEDDWDDRTRESSYDPGRLPVGLGDGPAPTSRAPSYGGAAAELEDRLAAIVAGTAGDAPAEHDTVAVEDDVAAFGIDPPSRGNGVVREPPAITWSDETQRPDLIDNEPPAEAAPEPTIRPAVRFASTAPSSIPSRAASTVESLQRPSAAGAAATPAPSKGRFGLTAVFAALGFGLSVGVVLGMLIAKLVFLPQQAPTSIPVKAADEVSRPP